MLAQHATAVAAAHKCCPMDVWTLVTRLAVAVRHARCQAEDPDIAAAIPGFDTHKCPARKTSQLGLGATFRYIAICILCVPIAAATTRRHGCNFLDIKHWLRPNAEAPLLVGESYSQRLCFLRPYIARRICLKRVATTRSLNSCSTT